jgi:hypothetical protein
MARPKRIPLASGKLVAVDIGFLEDIRETVNVYLDELKLLTCSDACDGCSPGRCALDENISLISSQIKSLDELIAYKNRKSPLERMREGLET